MRARRLTARPHRPIPSAPIYPPLAPRPPPPPPLSRSPRARSHGRRAVLLLNSLLYVASGLIQASSYTQTRSWRAETPTPSELCSPAPNALALLLLLCGRLLTGVACGISTVSVPMYLGEIAPAHLRGTLGSAFLLTAVTGMLIGQVLGLPGLLGTPTLWPAIFAAVCVPALIQLLLLPPHLVESPRWLLLLGASTSASAALATLRGCSEAEDELVD